MANKLKVYILGNFEKDEESEIRSVAEKLLVPLKGTGTAMYEVFYCNLHKINIVEEFKNMLNCGSVYLISERPHNPYTRQMLGLCNTLGITVLDAYTKQEIIAKEVLITTEIKRI